MIKDIISRCTPQADFRIPILIALEVLGGSAYRREVLAKVGEMLAGILTEADWQLVDSKSKQVYWQNLASWERKKMIADGLLAVDSPFGKWELTEKGRNHLNSLACAA